MNRPTGTQGPRVVSALARATLLVSALLGAACRTSDTPTWRSDGDTRWHELEVPRGSAGFTRMDAGKTGVRFQNMASEKILLGNRILGQGGGVSLGDVDGDGRPDIFLARTEGCRPLMELPDAMPDDVDYMWYVNEAASLLADLSDER